MLSFFKKKKIVPHLRLTGVIGNAGRFKQGIDFAGQEELIKKAFSIKKSLAIAISINSPGGSPVKSELFVILSVTERQIALLGPLEWRYRLGLRQNFYSLEVGLQIFVLVCFK